MFSGVPSLHTQMKNFLHFTYKFLSMYKEYQVRCFFFNRHLMFYLLWYGIFEQEWILLKLYDLNNIKSGSLLGYFSVCISGKDFEKL